MGTSWIVDTRTIDGIPFAELAKCELAHESKKNSDKEQLLSTGNGEYVWAYKTGDGMTNFETYGGNDSSEVFTALSRIFGKGDDITFLSEHDDDFRYLAMGPDFSTTHHRHGVDYEVALYVEDFKQETMTLTAEWRIDGELVDTDSLEIRKAEKTNGKTDTQQATGKQ